jgi:hypothetical protein
LRSAFGERRRPTPREPLNFRLNAVVTQHRRLVRRSANRVQVRLSDLRLFFSYFFLFFSPIFFSVLAKPIALGLRVNIITTARARLPRPRPGW